MNYTFYLVGDGGHLEDRVIGQITREPWERPTLGQELKIKSKLFKVVRITPADNPDNTTVSYYVEPLNSNWPYKNK